MKASDLEMWKDTSKAYLEGSGDLLSIGFRVDGLGFRDEGLGFRVLC